MNIVPLPVGGSTLSLRSDDLRQPGAAEVEATLDLIIEGLVASQVQADRAAAADYVERRLREGDRRLGQALASALRAGVHRGPTT